MQIKQVTVTPKKADELLKKNTANFRTPDKARVVRYSDDMTAGRWQPNGDTIKFSGDVLLDGQHRLLAVKRSGCSVPMVIVNGIDISAGQTLDDGKTRTTGEWLLHLGIKDSNSIAAAAKWCILYNKGLWSQSSHGVDKCSRGEVVDFAVANAEQLHKSTLMAARAKRMVSRSYFGALIFIAASGRDPQENTTLDWFSNSLGKGADIGEGDPVYHLRSRLDVDSRSSKKLMPFLQRMYLTMAWNKTALGESCKTLKYTSTGPFKTLPINKIELAPLNDA